MKMDELDNTEINTTENDQQLACLHFTVCDANNIVYPGEKGA